MMPVQRQRRVILFAAVDSTSYIMYAGLDLTGCDISDLASSTAVDSSVADHADLSSSSQERIVPKTVSPNSSPSLSSVIKVNGTRPEVPTDLRSKKLEIHSALAQYSIHFGHHTADA